MIRERRTVVYGDGDTAEVLPAGAELDDAVGLRINDRAFDKIGPVVKTLTTIDTGAIAPPGTVFLDECITQVIVCTLHARASTSAPPTIADFSVALDSNQDNVNAVVTLTDLHVPVDVDARILGIPTSCDLVIDADSVTIDGNYALAARARPTPASSTSISSGASPVVTLGNVNDDFVGGICSIPVIEQIVGLFLPDVRTLMQENLTRLLGDADGAGPASTRRSPTPSSRRWRRSTSPATSAPPSGCGSTRTSPPPTRTRTASTCTPPPRSRRSASPPRPPT